MKYYFDTQEQINGDIAYNNKDYQLALSLYKRSSDNLQALATQNQFKPNVRYYDGKAYVLTEMLITTCRIISSSLENGLDIDVDAQWQMILNLLEKMEDACQHISSHQSKRTNLAQIQLMHTHIAEICEQISDTLVDASEEEPNKSLAHIKIENSLSWLKKANAHKVKSGAHITLAMHLSYLYLMQSIYKSKADPRLLQSMSQYIERHNLASLTSSWMDTLEVMNYKLFIAILNKSPNAQEIAARCKQLMDSHTNEIEQDNELILETNTLITKLSESSQRSLDLPNPQQAKRPNVEYPANNGLRQSPFKQPSISQAHLSSNMVEKPVHARPDLSNLQQAKRTKLEHTLNDELRPNSLKQANIAQTYPSSNKIKVVESSHTRPDLPNLQQAKRTKVEHTIHDGLRQNQLKQSSIAQTHLSNNTITESFRTPPAQIDSRHSFFPAVTTTNAYIEDKKADLEHQEIYAQAFINMMKAYGRKESPPFLANLLTLIGDFYQHKLSHRFHHELAIEMYEAATMMIPGHHVATERLKIYSQPQFQKIGHWGASSTVSNIQDPNTIFLNAVEQNIEEVDGFLAGHNTLSMASMLPELLDFMTEKVVLHGIFGGNSKKIMETMTAQYQTNLLSIQEDTSTSLVFQP